MGGAGKRGRQKKRIGTCLPFRGRCYDNNFLRFLPIYPAKKLPFFSKTNVMITIFAKLALFCDKNANIFAQIFGENILKKS
jgi:hypothetical protein